MGFKAQMNRECVMSLTHSIPAADVSREAADALISASIDLARNMGLEVAVGIVDRGGTLKCFSRSDKAAFLTVDVAIDKAWTAVYGYPTHIWNSYIQDTNVAPLAYHPRMMAVGGGYPIRKDGMIIGGIGISGGNYVEDQQIALSALRAVGFDDEPS